MANINKSKKTLIGETEEVEREIKLESLVDFDEDLDIIYIFEEISDSTALDVVKTINKANENPECNEITIFLNTSGGSASAAFCICDAMLSCKKPVRTIATGKIMSAGIPILGCGTRGMREAREHTFVMIHQPSVTQESLTTSESMMLSNAMSTLTKHLVNLSTRFSSKKQRKAFWKYLEANIDIYSDAKLLLELGVVDKIISHNGDV